MGRQPQVRWPLCSTTWARLTLALWLVVLAGICARTFLANIYTHNVYPIFAYAAERWLAGEGIYMTYTTYRDIFRYSPLAAVLFIPWQLLPDHTASVAWRLLNTALLLGALHLWLRHCWANPWSKTQYWQILLLLLPLVVDNINNGQINPMLLSLLLLATTAVARGRWTLASVCIALACYLKVYPIALGLLLMLLYPRQLPWRVALALVVGFLVPFACQRPTYVWGQYVEWIRYLQFDDRQGASLHTLPRDVRMLLGVFAINLTQAAYLALQAGMGALIAAVCWRTQHRGVPEPRVLLGTLALASGWMLVFGPATESCTYMLLAPPLVAMLCERWHQPCGAAWSRFALLAAYVGLLAAHLGATTGHTILLSYYGRPLVTLCYFGGVLVWLWLQDPEEVTSCAVTQNEVPPLLAA